LVYTGRNVANGAVLSDKVIQTMLCPSSPLPKFVLVGSTPGQGVLSPTYTGISGAVDHYSTLDRDGETYAHYGKGKISRGGALLSHENKKLIDIKDGTSSTIGWPSNLTFALMPAKLRSIAGVILAIVLPWGLDRLWKTGTGTSPLCGTESTTKLGKTRG